MKIDRILKKIIKDLDDENMVVKKTIPAKKEWQEVFDQIKAMSAEIEALEGKRDAIKKRLWADIELDSNEFGSLRYNRERTEIEVLENPGDKKAIRSPYSPI